MIIKNSQNSYVSNKCHALLKDFNSEDETRSGYVFLAVLWPLLGIAIALFLLITALDSNWPDPIVILMIILNPIWIILGGIQSSVELNLWFLNRIKKYIKIFEGFLQPDEKILAYCYGKTYEGLTKYSIDISALSLFIFTNKKLILILFNSQITGINQIISNLSKGQFNSCIEIVESCPLGDPKKVYQGGLMMPPMLHFVYKKITVTGEQSKIKTSWYINVKITKMEKNINRIFNILNS